MFDQAGPKWHRWVCSALLNNRRSNVTFYNSLGNQVNTLLLLLSMRRTDKGSTEIIQHNVILSMRICIICTFETARSLSYWLHSNTLVYCSRPISFLAVFINKEYWIADISSNIWVCSDEIQMRYRVNNKWKELYQLSNEELQRVNEQCALCKRANLLSDVSDVILSLFIITALGWDVMHHLNGFCLESFVLEEQKEHDFLFKFSLALPSSDMPPLKKSMWFTLSDLVFLFFLVDEYV